MNDMARILIVIGGICIVLGCVVFFLGKIPGVGRLPGDILIKKENFTFYFPITTCLLLSIILTLIFFLWQRK